MTARPRNSPDRRDALRAIGLFAAAPIATACGIEPGPSRARSLRPSPNARPGVIRGRATTDGQGAQLVRLFPAAPGDHVDPFVLLDDFGVAPPAGFPTHPHRGFEAFTYMLDGAFEHRDNLGNVSRVTTGGVQLFTSGRGAFHSEMPGQPRINRGMQLWVNLPRRLKQMTPSYVPSDGREIPEISTRGVRTRVVVGRGSPVRVQTEMRYLDLVLARGDRFTDEMPAGWKSILYVVDGRVRVGDVVLDRGEAALPRPGEFDIAALGASRVVWIAGQSHNEPIYQHGPYVD